MRSGKGDRESKASFLCRVSSFSKPPFSPSPFRSRTNRLRLNGMINILGGSHHLRLLVVLVCSPLSSELFLSRSSALSVTLGERI
ncbi:hypothetical protein LZ31DRAFT_225044 [Colletotrichum somersetense]|nr:hypothetical protein LZ31DRAFT_225044 [Colletotrichum somersetense]